MRWLTVIVSLAIIGAVFGFFPGVDTGPGSGFSRFPEKTTALISSLSSCSTKVTSDKDCISSVKDGLEKVSDYIQKVRDIRTKMQKIYTGMGSMTTILDIGAKLPTIGGAIRGLKITIGGMKSSMKAGLNQAKAVDDKIYPWKAKVDRGVEACDEAINVLDNVKTKCEQGSSALGVARACIIQMSGSSRRALEINMENLAGAVDEVLTDVNTVFGKIGSGCAVVKDFVDKAKRWPDLDSIRSRIRSMYDVMEPIITFFRSLEGALNHKICIPEELIPGSAGRRFIRRVLGRKRSLVRPKRDACFSVMDVINGVGDALNTVLAPLNAIIDAIVDAAPSFSLPGMPDLGNLFRFDLNINIPNIDFNINFLGAFPRFNLISWECASQINDVCESGARGVAIDCRRPSLGTYLGCYQDASSRDLSSYTLNMGSRATIEHCFSLCRGRGFRYAAVQFYSHCFCDNNYGKYSRKSESDCSTPCRANEGQKCGGVWRNSVYELN